MSLLAEFGSAFDALLGVGSWPEPPGIVPLRILGLAAMPGSREQLRAAFRARLRVVHPDATAYAAVPWLQDAADAIAAGRPEVAELVWARDVLLRKIPPAVTASGSTGAPLISRHEPQKCKGCGGTHVVFGGTVRGFRHGGRWGGYCWPCAADAENGRERELRREARADWPCGSCQRPFTPPRADGRYCSPACRQRAYRQRTRSQR